MVTGYDDGLIKFASIGGIDERILPGKRVLVGEKRIPGVIVQSPFICRKRLIPLKRTELSGLKLPPWERKKMR